MSKKNRIYAVKKGHTIGLFSNWRVRAPFKVLPVRYIRVLNQKKKHTHFLKI